MDKIYARLEDQLRQVGRKLASSAISVLNTMASNDKQATLNFLYEKEDSPLMEAVMDEEIDSRFSDDLRAVLSTYRADQMKI